MADRERLEPVAAHIAGLAVYFHHSADYAKGVALAAEATRNRDQRVARLVLLWAADSLSSGYLLPDGMKKIANDPSRVAYLLRLLEGKG